MKLKQVPFIAATLVATAFVVGCGNQNDQRLSDSDVAYLKQQRLLAMYGGGSTTTSTSTVMQYVTITNTQTVNVSH